MSAPKTEIAAVGSYAQALFNVGKAKGIGAEMLEGSRAMADALRKSPDLQAFLDSPKIPRQAKATLSEKAFGGKVHPVVVTMLKMLIERGRTALLPAILAEFEAVSERAQGIYPASVTTARELPAGEANKLKAGLEKWAGCQLKIAYHVRPDLIGGVPFRFKDQLVDATVRRGLEDIKKRLEGGGLSAQ